MREQIRDNEKSGVPVIPQEQAEDGKWVLRYRQYRYKDTGPLLGAGCFFCLSVKKGRKYGGVDGKGSYSLLRQSFNRAVCLP